jgi:methylmalonyl-CoA carboxyltransferase large subunit
MPDTKIDPETLMIMSAAIAAYLGKNVRIRKARFILEQGISPWSMQGRVSLQTSHSTHGVAS